MDQSINNRAVQTLLLKNIKQVELVLLLGKYGLTLNIGDTKAAIPGSFWGDEEAGLIGNQVFARLDTPIHSVLHETCHYICMDHIRRLKLHTNAGGTNNEENAVCYLQILLSDQFSFIDRFKMMQDMDSWGYSFRLGSAKAWFESDAEDARQWLLKHQLINRYNNTTFKLRT